METKSLARGEQQTETGLEQRTERTAELATAGEMAETQVEIQSAIIIARRFPRNEEEAFQKVMKAALRPSFAEDAAYKFPRGGQQISGPSVNIAREAARVWGNIRYGLDVLRDDLESRLIRGWAWDLETNTKVTAEDDFKKTIFRKQQGWITPDERDLRELTNRRGAILVRNCLLQLLPKDLIEDALSRCEQTLQSRAKEDPDYAKKKLIVDFASVNVTVPALEKFLKHPLAEASPQELADLRGIYKSIADGNSTWADYGDSEPQSDDKKKGLKDKLKDKAAEATADRHAPTPPGTPVPKAAPAASPSGKAPPQNVVAYNDYLAGLEGFQPDQPDKAVALMEAACKDVRLFDSDYHKLEDYFYARYPSVKRPGKA